MTKKEKLIEALEADKERIGDKVNGFGGVVSRDEFDMAIDYLKTGKIPTMEDDMELEDYEILQGVVENIDEMYESYGIE